MNRMLSRRLHKRGYDVALAVDGSEVPDAQRLDERLQRRVVGEHRLHRVEPRVGDAAAPWDTIEQRVHAPPGLLVVAREPHA